MLQDEIVARLRKYFAKRNDIVLAYLFGSQAQGTATAGRSDFDIAVYFKKAAGHTDYEADTGLFPAESEITSDLMDITGTEVDLIVLNRAPASMVFTAMNGTIMLAQKDHDLFMKLLLRSSADADDYRELVHDFYEIALRSNSLSAHDRERLERILVFLNSELAQLPEMATMDQKTFEHDRNARRILERSVEIIVNAAIDIAKILIASRKGRIPDRYADIMRHLGYLEKFDDSVATWLAEAATLRNFVAHEYLDLEYARIQKLVAGAQKNFRYLIDYARTIVKNESNRIEQ